MSVLSAADEYEVYADEGRFGPGTPEVSLGDLMVRKYEPFVETLTWFLDVLPDDTSVIIAGGAVRDLYVLQDPKAIKDIDLWILGVSEQNSQPLQDMLATAYLPYTDNPPVAIDVGPSGGGGGPAWAPHLPLANLTFPWCPVPCQLMFTEHATAADLLFHFDWRACAFAFDGERVLIPGMRDFDIATLTLTPSPILYPKSTLRRGFAFEWKYRHTSHRLALPNATILALASMLTLDDDGEERETV